ncbi:hypothetical protein Tco_0638120 [Tanacetum coccineum]
MPVTRQGYTIIMTPETVQAMIDQALQRNPTNTHDDGSQNSDGGPGRPVQPARVKGNDVGGYTQRFQELALMCTKFLSDETEKVDKYISGLPDNIHGNVMNQGHYKSDCSDLKNQNYGNQAEYTEARGMVYALGGGETNQDLNNMEDDINA